MKVFVAGATGAIGKQLVPQLVAAGHRVIAATRTEAKCAALRTAGAVPVVVDGLDKDAVMQAVTAARPEAIVHQMTALASMRSLKHFDDEFALTNRLRTEGTEHLLAAAHAVGARRIVVQSYTGWTNARTGSRIKSEDDPLDPDLPKTMTKTFAAIATLERRVESASDIAGTILRYGSLYGPGTGFAHDGEVVALVRARRLPIVGQGGGVWSFIHVADAARAVVVALEREMPGVYNIVDDDPAEVSVWLPVLATTLGTKPPRHLPVWLARFVLGDAGVYLMTGTRGSSNAKARNVLRWQPSFATWRDGFRRSLAVAA